MGTQNNQGGSTAEFDDFVTNGVVEIGKSDADTGDEGGDEGKSAKPAARRGPPKTKADDVAAAGDDDDSATGGEGDDDDSAGGEGDEDGKPKKTAREHQIDRLKREKRDLARQLREARAGGNPDLVKRLENIEGGLQGGNGGDTKPARAPAPDPTDATKYPLGHLDDRYIEDKLEWLAEDKASKQADSVLQRQRESEQTQAQREATAALLDKVDGLSAKGSELFDDFQESVVEAGMRGDWALSQTTFEAAHEAEHGAQILYELSQDPAEARRVAKLPPYQQLKYVVDKDAEIGSGKKPRTKPKAGEPPRHQPRGANSKTSISPATDNLDDFEKAWKRDAEKSKH